VGLTGGLDPLYERGVVGTGGILDYFSVPVILVSVGRHPVSV
jgi:hypothetical protein